VFMVFGGELGEVLGGFVEHDLEVGIDAVLKEVRGLVDFKELAWLAAACLAVAMG